MSLKEFDLEKFIGSPNNIYFGFIVSRAGSIIGNKNN